MKITDTWLLNIHQEKKLTMVFFSFLCTKMYLELDSKRSKTGVKGVLRNRLFLIFLHEKRLSSGQKWFLRPYFPLSRGMFVFRSGLRFSKFPKSRIDILLEVILLHWRQSFSAIVLNDLFITLSSGTSSVRNENLRPLLDTHIPLISGKYFLRNRI